MTSFIFHRKNTSPTEYTFVRWIHLNHRKVDLSIGVRLPVLDIIICKTVLAYLKTYTLNSSLSLKEISHKLVMLLALVSIQPKQTLVHLNINNNYMVKSDNQFVFVVDGHVKQSQPNYSVPPILIPRYTIDPDICPYVCLEDYLERTKNLRQNGTLLIATIKPHRPTGLKL